MFPLTKPIILSDLMQGTTFEFSSTQYDDCEGEDLFWSDDQPVDDYKNPCETSFEDWKSTMTEVCEDVLKKVIKTSAKDAKQIDLLSQRITYHRNLYVENENHPFDSTYLNGKSDEICLPMNTNGVFLIGFLEALESMKEGEKSLFLIGYKKMFKESGSPPRIPEKADILCELEVLKVQDVGDQEVIDQLEAKENQNFSDKKKSVEEVFIRASDYFSRGKIESAIKIYKCVIQEATFTNVRDEEEKKARNDIFIRAHLNLAVCLNKTDKYDETLTHIRYLENICCIDDQPKALYVKGFALMKLGELNQAVVPLTKALKLKPLDQQIIKAIEELNNRKKTYDNNRKAFGKNLRFN